MLSPAVGNAAELQAARLPPPPPSYPTEKDKKTRVRKLINAPRESGPNRISNYSVISVFVVLPPGPSTSPSATNAMIPHRAERCRWKNLTASRRVSGVTTMLNFFTTSNGFRGTLPVVSNLTAMNVWDGVCMCFIYASLLEFVCVNYVGRKRPMHNVVYRPGENPVTQVLC